MNELEKILEEIKDELKDIYLDIANNYNISDLQYDGDKVACVASKFRCDAGRRIEKIILKRMNDGWIPVEERLPEDGQTVLCTDGQYVYLVEYDADLDAPFGDVDNITDWQPSPEPYRPERSKK